MRNCSSYRRLGVGWGGGGGTDGLQRKTYLPLRSGGCVSDIYKKEVYVTHHWKYYTVLGDFMADYTRTCTVYIHIFYRERA
jgi:hypothetical protein